MDNDDIDPYAVAAVRTRAVVLQAARSLAFQELPLESFSGGLHVQIRIRSVGLSSGDLSYYTTFAHVGHKLRSPIVLGKEAAGQIVAVGAYVSKTFPHLSIGTRVVIEPGIPCRICHDCQMGRYNVCPNKRTAGSAEGRTTQIHGCLRKLVNWPAEMVHPMPTNVPYDLAILTEPLAHVIHACQRAKLQPTTSVMVLGSGVIGFLICAYTHFLGCYPICIADIDSARLDIAVDNEWASHKYVFSSPPSDVTTADGMLDFRRAVSDDIKKRMHRPAGYETCFDATGSEAGAQSGIFLAKRAGKLVLTTNMSYVGQYIPMSIAVSNEIDVICTSGSAHTFEPALSCLAAGTLGNLRSLLTQKVSFDNAEKGFKWMLRGKDREERPVVKVIVEGAES
ncbi:MAG: hypothetical protein CYPHOPRED_003741 [Cyphobasidiales sp. Tagirdzhanova-0007]|nr:MAG: hypothetical protein CYPHOPRED_003741 [Cyphobasidiales sp. Tagirdzhanova-0007]